MHVFLRQVAKAQRVIDFHTRNVDVILLERAQLYLHPSFTV